MIMGTCLSFGEDFLHHLHLEYSVQSLCNAGPGYINLANINIAFEGVFVLYQIINKIQIFSQLFIIYLYFIQMMNDVLGPADSLMKCCLLR